MPCKHHLFTVNQMNGYCKLFTDIVTSTIWQTPLGCRVLWVTMLALKDETNICRATVPALAKLCDITIEDCQKYLNDFQSPDEFSRSQEYEGKRIEQVEGGWLILNGQKYRDMLRGQERRDYIRQKVAEHRARVNKCKPRKQSKPIAEAKAEAKADKENKDELVVPEKFSQNADFLNAWNEWMDFRKSKKACKNWAKLFGKQLEWINGFEVPTAIEILNQSIRNDWQGLFEPPKNGHSKHATQGTLSGIDKAILQKEKDLIVARISTIRSQYDGHQSWSEKDKTEVGKLKPRLAEINSQLGCLL